MKVTIDDIKRFSFCPKFYEQKGPLLKEKSQADFCQLLTYMFRRDLETESKQDYAALEKRWRKIFFVENESVSQERLQAFNRSLVALHKFHRWYLEQRSSVVAINHSFVINVYGHELMSEVPVILMEEAGCVSLIMTEPLDSIHMVKLEPAIRYVSMVLGEELEITKIYNLALIDHKIFHLEEFIPNNRYWESAMIDFVGVVQSMSSNTYPNTFACPTCPINKTCEVLKGNA